MCARLDSWRFNGQLYEERRTIILTTFRTREWPAVLFTFTVTKFDGRWHPLREGDGTPQHTEPSVHYHYHSLKKTETLTVEGKPFDHPRGTRKTGRRPTEPLSFSSRQPFFSTLPRNRLPVFCLPHR